MKENKAIAPDAYKDFLRELASLRAHVDEVAEQYSLGVKPCIDEMMHLLAGTGAPEAGHMLPDPRIQDLVDALTDTMQGND